MLYGYSPQYSHIKIFSCPTYTHDHSLSEDKFRAHSCSCVFLGYTFGKKGWHLYDLELKKIFVYRDVVFDETTLPYANENSILDNHNHIRNSS